MLSICRRSTKKKINEEEDQRRRGKSKNGKPTRINDHFKAGGQRTCAISGTYLPTNLPLNHSFPYLIVARLSSVFCCGRWSARNYLFPIREGESASGLCKNAWPELIDRLIYSFFFGGGGVRLLWIRLPIVHSTYWESWLEWLNHVNTSETDFSSCINILHRSHCSPNKMNKRKQTTLTATTQVFL